MKIVDGTKISEAILDGCSGRLSKLGLTPKLAIIMIGNNPSSLIYIEKKRQAGEKIGVAVDIYKYDTVDQVSVLKLIKDLSEDITVHGIIVQLPLPDGFNEYEICSAINPNKDVDGLNPVSFGELWLKDNPKLVPATVRGIEKVIQFIAQEEGIEYSDYISGKNVLIINRSQIIGKPLAGLMIKYDATVFMAHSKTKNLNNLISIADIIVSGTGKEDFISSQTFKQGTVLIDVGFNKTDKRIFGDVNKSINTERIAWLTPVPGGVGPVGVACLIENVVDVACSQNPLYPF